MPLFPESYDDVVNAVAALLPVGSTVRLYSALADAVEGPDPADELPTEGGYAPFVTTEAFSTSTGGEGLASLDLAWSATDVWPETGVAWAGEDPDGTRRAFDLLQTKVEVGEDEVGGTVTATADIYIRPADGA